MIAVNPHVCWRGIKYDESLPTNHVSARYQQHVMRYMYGWWHAVWELSQTASCTNHNFDGKLAVLSRGLGTTTTPHEPPLVIGHLECVFPASRQQTQPHDGVARAKGGLHGFKRAPSKPP